MSDTLRVVTFSAGGRPVVVRDLDDGATYTRARGSFKFTPGAPTPVMSRQQRRYGGARIVGPGGRCAAQHERDERRANSGAALANHAKHQERPLQEPRARW